LNILVIGLGQCGARLADEFARQHARARSKRGPQHHQRGYAVSADMEDLVGLTDIESNYKHRILPGRRYPEGAGGYKGDTNWALSS
jgi:cell division GTPase FtsZ